VIDFVVKELKDDFDLFEIIFDNREYAKLAKRIVEEIDENNGIEIDFFDSVVEDLASETVFDKPSVIDVFRQLLRIGIVECEHGVYVLSKKFSNALRKIAKKWENIVEPEPEEKELTDWDRLRIWLTTDERKCDLWGSVFKRR